MRTIKGRTLKEIVKRDKREAVRGRGTYYRIDYMGWRTDGKYLAELSTKNNKYLFQRNNLGLYKLINKKSKGKDYVVNSVYE